MISVLFPLPVRIEGAIIKRARPYHTGSIVVDQEDATACVLEAISPEIKKAEMFDEIISGLVDIQNKLDEEEMNINSKEAEEKERLAADKKALLAPDKAKIKQIAMQLRVIEQALPSVKSEEANAVILSIRLLSYFPLI